MKKLLLYLMLICFGATNSFSNVSPEKEFLENTENQGEIVIVFENLNMKLFAEFDQAISNIKGIKNTGYCQQMNCYYFSYDSSMYRSGEEAYVEVCKAAKNFLPIYKEGTTSEMVKRACINLQN